MPFLATGNSNRGIRQWGAGASNRPARGQKYPARGWPIGTRMQWGRSAAFDASRSVRHAAAARSRDADVVSKGRAIGITRTAGTCVQCVTADRDTNGAPTDIRGAVTCIAVCACPTGHREIAEVVVRRTGRSDARTVLAHLTRGAPTGGTAYLAGRAAGTVQTGLARRARTRGITYASLAPALTHRGITESATTLRFRATVSTVGCTGFGGNDVAHRLESKEASNRRRCQSLEYLAPRGLAGEQPSDFVEALIFHCSHPYGQTN